LHLGRKKNPWTRRSTHQESPEKEKRKLWASSSTGKRLWLSKGKLTKGGRQSCNSLINGEGGEKFKDLGRSGGKKRCPSVGVPKKKNFSTRSSPWKNANHQGKCPILSWFGRKRSHPKSQGPRGRWRHPVFCLGYK